MLQHNLVKANEAVEGNVLDLVTFAMRSEAISNRKANATTGEKNAK